MPQRRKSPSANSAEKTDALIESVDLLSAEVRCLREVLDEVREDFSWLTRNGLPIRPVEHVHVRRMARDINADDWAARLVVDRFELPETAQASLLESDSLDDLARNLTAAFEAAAKGQLEPSGSRRDFFVRGLVIHAMLAKGFGCRLCKVIGNFGNWRDLRRVTGPFRSRTHTVFSADFTHETAVSRPQRAKSAQLSREQKTYSRDPLISSLRC